PICVNGWMEVEVDGQVRRIGITRAHLEEDTGKLLHVDGRSLIDFNRAGVPLLEIVTEADIRSAAEASAYLTKLRQLLRYLGVSSGDMEKGAMRCEANVSVRPVGSTEFGTKVEIKNLNSFRAVRMALEYEIARQIEVLEAGGEIRQVTMGWDETHNRTVVQRSKEFAHDYRYFPEPDLLPLEISREWVDQLCASLPELPDAKRERFIRDYGLTAQEAATLVEEKEIASYYEALVAVYQGSARAAASWVTGELFRLMHATGIPIEGVKVTPEALADLLRLIDQGTINANTGKQVLDEMFETGRSAAAIVEARGLAQVSDAEALAVIIAQILEDNPDEVARYRGGKKTLLGWFMGQVMKRTRGKANPAIVRQLLQ
ncbi:MAG TPA: Asp-tRNA(Asn)/Glu-tRNA(Gln) amidotransferase subunit GatB, partial [Anaerolineae bacterium]|nr:Asp-tRNA(Asn)/Glu-tRNA(Gln) amidotransferase subunit GatB [Anaerolineae bacterium]